MKKLIALLALCLCIFGCTPASSPSSGGAATSQAQQDAALVVQGLNTAWKAVATACFAAEDQALLKSGSCSALLPAYDGIVEGAHLVDTWDDAAQKNLPCTVADVVLALQQGEAILTDLKLTIDPKVQAAIAAGEAFAAGLCVRTDAGT